ncbi:MAG: peptidyl-prolyl cis-trans isomerase [Cyclobacteriaceae bacterium]|nr:peptidyl-prolyl cis-trans isomerase [Cyclobacteriaceae bacterium HetDA_MAG_MS6]
MKGAFRIWGIFVLLGCEYFQPKSEISFAAVARAGEAFLYQDELAANIPSNIRGEDSARLADKYVLDWIKKRLIVDKANAEINFDGSKIDRKVRDYRHGLIVHEFEKFYINAHLDVAVDSSEIAQYYSEWSQNFLLKQNIIKCIFAQLPKNSPDLRTFRRNFRAYPGSNKDDIQDYLYQFAIKSFTDDSVWVNFDELIVNTPLKDITNRKQYLAKTKYSETSDPDYIYFLKILDFKISDEISPLEFIREDIENIIINRRKIALKKELEQAIYEEARKNSTFEIFSN